MQVRGGRNSLPHSQAAPAASPAWEEAGDQDCSKLSLLVPQPGKPGRQEPQQTGGGGRAVQVNSPQFLNLHFFAIIAGKQLP